MKRTSDDDITVDPVAPPVVIPNPTSVQNPITRSYRIQLVIGNTSMTNPVITVINKALDWLHEPKKEKKSVKPK